MARGVPFPPTHSCARSYEACTAMQRAGSELSQPRLRETGAARERRAQGPRNSVSKPGARRWVPPQYRARPRPRLRNIAPRLRDAGDAKQPKKPRGYSRQQPTCRRRVRYLPSRPLRMPGEAAAGNPGPLPAGGHQAEPEPRRQRGEGAASRGAAALPAGGFSVSFRALAGTGLPRARRGCGQECARVGRCGRAWMWVCMCVCVFMGEVGVCVRV